MRTPYSSRSKIRQQIYNEIAQLEAECNKVFDENIQRLDQPVKILALVNFKDGVGKTSITHALAEAFVRIHHCNVQVVSPLLKKRMTDYGIRTVFEIVNTIPEINAKHFDLILIDQDKTNSVAVTLKTADFAIIPGQLTHHIWYKTMRTAECAKSIQKPYGVFIHKTRYYKSKSAEEMYYNRDENALMKEYTFQHLINSATIHRLKDSL